MAHFAELDENNKVIRVIVVHDNELLENGVESEEKGINFCQSLFGGNWKKTSYNATAGKYRDPITYEITDSPGFRKNFAGIGYSYDPVRDAFIPPMPSEGEWVLNEEKSVWEMAE